MSALKQALLIEDNIIAQRIPSIILEESGCKVDIAENGAQAIQMINQSKKKYDLILLDIGLPGMDGFTLAKELRKIPQLNESPIIGLTAHIEGEHQCEFIDETLSKPFTKTLLSHIQQRFFIK